MEAATTPTADQLYQGAVKPLPPSERLNLATLILNDIAPESVVDFSEDWSDEDLKNFQRASWDHINRRLDEEKAGV